MATVLQTFTSIEVRRTMAIENAAKEPSARQEAVKNALADLRIEGLTPSEHVRCLLEEFVAGHVSVLELYNNLLPR